MFAVSRTDDRAEIAEIDIGLGAHDSAPRNASMVLGMKPQHDVPSQARESVRAGVPLAHAATSRALWFDGARMTLDDRSFPTPGVGEALMRATRVSIASADVAVADGRADFRGVMGHECVGVVEAVGPTPEGRTDASRWVGRRVVVNPVVACGACETCKGGLSQHCPKRRVMGLHGMDGCFADVFVAPVANLVEVPKGVGDDAACMASTLAGALHACRFVRVETKPFVTVLGDGPVGLLVAQALAKRNASVRVLGKHPARLAICEKLGIRHRLLAEAGLRQDQDVVIDCTGSSHGTHAALLLARPRGTVVVKGWMLPARASQGAARIGLAAALANELTIIGAAGGSVAEAVACLERSEVDVLPLITKRCKLTHWEQAFDAARSSEQMKVVMDV